MRSSISIYVIIISMIFILSGCHNKENSPGHMSETGMSLANDIIIQLQNTYCQGFIIGYSVQKRPLHVTRLGRGKERAIVLIGCVHGEEKNTEELIRNLQGMFAKNYYPIPRSCTVFFLPLMNPDGYANGTRENARKVDLNRNFPTEDWMANALGMYSVVPGLGGKSPGSEPEVAAVAAFLLDYIKSLHKKVWVLAFHSACPPVGYIQPGYIENGKPDPASAKTAKQAADFAGYRYLHGWVDKVPVTGELIHFCVMNEMIAMDVELPTYDPPHNIPEGKKESAMDMIWRMVKQLLILE